MTRKDSFVFFLIFCAAALPAGYFFFYKKQAVAPPALEASAPLSDVAAENNYRPNMDFSHFLAMPPDGMGLREAAEINNLLVVLNHRMRDFYKYYPALEKARSSAGDLTMELRKLMNAGRQKFAKEAAPDAALNHFLAIAGQTDEFAKQHLWRRCYFYHDDVSTFSRENLNPKRLPQIYRTYAQMADTTRPEYAALLEQGNIPSTLLQFRYISGAIYQRAFKEAAGSDDEKDNYAGCQAELMVIQMVSTAAPALRGPLAKGYFLTRFY